MINKVRLYNLPHQLMYADQLNDSYLPVEECARAVREILVKKGWVQNSYEGPSGGFCLAGAIRYFYGMTFPSELIYSEGEKLRERIGNLLAKRGVPDYAQWNDEPGRTKKEVLSLLRSVERGYGK